ncbi:uncharacterized protein LOC132034989 [Lycium ferocissimum]|uniref:uncharacterized protein LOC132034989 n=1 Tax=Lycium ferocissimum TaxID=112874 RepID=UPI00281507FE|nr:uncharacterized protein LOC132034989 [Lycium ferocissimum]
MATSSTTTTPRYGQRDTTFSTPIFTPSHSSVGSLSFHDHHDSPFSPFQFSTKGVPFSWEHIPGIPKQQISRKNSSSLRQLLPLPPPAGNPPNSAKKTQRVRDEFSPRKSTASESFRKDPFFAAFVECSKDQQENHENFSNMWKSTTSSSKVVASPTRSLSDRFGVISMSASCKRACSVSESIVCLPRSRNYDLLSTRRTSR